MNIFLNIILARIGVILAVFCTIIYFFRVFNKNSNSIKSINKFLRKTHKILGILLVVLGLIHGLLSSQSIFSLNLGTFCEVLSILLGVNWYIGTKYKMKRWINHHRFLTVLFLVVLILHIIDVGGFTPDLINKSFNNNYNSIEKNDNTSNSNNKSATSFKYKDGVYQGVTHGYGPNLTVSVTVKNGTISNIEIVSHNERNPRFYQAPMNKVPAEIIKSQSTDVDIVVGSTKTSKGIMNAVKDALSKASQ